MKLPLEGIEGNWDAIEEGLAFETIISSSLGNCCSTIEFTFTATSSFKETKQMLGQEIVQNQKGDDFLKRSVIEKIFEESSPWSLSSVVAIEIEFKAIWLSPSSYTNSNQQIILSIF